MRPTERFSSRVDHYIKYRPHYPQQVIRILEEECGLIPEWTIADIGSGTGISTELFLRNGNPTIGVEPNREMREAAERLLARCRHFTSVNATAEATTLPDSSVEMTAAGQAFHWFDRTAAGKEFARILKPGGWVVLMWNDRRTGGSRFLDGYENILKDYATDYAQVNHRNIDDRTIAEFFAPYEYKLRTCPNSQEFDFGGLRGRLLSSSYAPEPADPNYEPMIEALARLFEKHQQDGRVTMEYETQVYVGRLS